MYQYFGWHLPEEETEAGHEHEHEQKEDINVAAADDNNQASIEMTSEIKSKERDIYVSVDSDPREGHHEAPSHGEVALNEDVVEQI